MRERYVHCLYCDDARQEDNGKRLYIGVYSARMLVRSFPTTLPSFVVVLTVATPASRPIRELKIRLLKDDEELFSSSLSEESLEEVAEKISDKPEENLDERIMQFQTHVRFSPFSIDRPCRIKVRVDTEEGELRGTSLDVGSLPDEE